MLVVLLAVVFVVALFEAYQVGSQVFQPPSPPHDDHTSICDDGMVNSLISSSPPS